MRKSAYGGLEVGMSWTGSENRKKDQHDRSLVNGGVSDLRVAGKLRPGDIQPSRPRERVRTSLYVRSTTRHWYPLAHSVLKALEFT